jgi:hypothetical protein
MLHSGPALLSIPEVLTGLDIVPRGESVRYVFEDSTGQHHEEEFVALSFDSAAASMTERVLSPVTGPLFARDRDAWYVLDPVPQDHLLYVRINRSLDQKGKESLAAFAQRLADALRPGSFSAVVVDLRQDTGGNVHKTEPLAEVVSKAVKRGSIASVYVGLGRHTYSAAVLLAAQLKHDCGARFVGEVPRAVPNHQADAEHFELPNSKIEVSYSSKLWRLFPELGEARTIPIDLPAAWTWDDYRSGRDPMLEAIQASIANPNAHPPTSRVDSVPPSVASRTK